jgi:hypothetical protein
MSVVDDAADVDQAADAADIDACGHYWPRHRYVRCGREYLDT